MTDLLWAATISPVLPAVFHVVLWPSWWAHCRTWASHRKMRPISRSELGIAAVVSLVAAVGSALRDDLSLTRWHTVTLVLWGALAWIVDQMARDGSIPNPPG